MSELTPNLKLFKYNTETDAKQPFSINDCMNANWDKLDASLGSLEIGDIGMSLYVDETKGKRRYLNGQIVDRNANTEAFFKRLQEITTLYPSLLCTEDEWQTAKTMSVFGQVGKFVFNYADDGVTVVSVRIPRVVNVQGVFDLQNLGISVAESLPNITGSLSSVYGSSNTCFKSASGFVSLSDSRIDGVGISSHTEGPAYVNADFDASKSSSAYKDNAPVQQEAIQYPYFIQIATGTETQANIINEITNNSPYELFDFKWADHEQNNISWLKSYGQWSSGSVYADAYNELMAEYNNAESVEETEGSITFRRTPKGYKIALADQDTTIENKYNTDGIAWYYVLDTANTQFKLPRTKFGFEGLRTTVGDDIAESLPSHTHTENWVFSAGVRPLSPVYNASATTGSAKSLTTSLSNTSYEDGGELQTGNPSGSTYQKNAPVQERATQMYLYFYVGETVQNANLIDAGRIGEQLPNKADFTYVDTRTSRYVLEESDKSLMPSWYVVYNDGWCEQGSVATVPTGSGDVWLTIDLLKPFIDTKYSIQTQFFDWKSSTAMSFNWLGVFDRTTSSFSMMVSQSWPKSWYACGYVL